MARKGRPATRALDLRDGFYLELKNSASSKGIKIRRDTQKEMEDAIEEYSKTKIVVVLGEYKDGKALNYSLYMMKGARFKLSGENPDNETGSDFFKLMPDGNVKKIVIVRASSIEGVASDITVPDAFYAGRTKTNKRGIRKPLIIANRNFWIAD